MRILLLSHLEAKLEHWHRAALAKGMMTAALFQRSILEALMR